MTKSDELAYLRGQRSIWLRLLRDAARDLGQDSPEWTAERWRIEREETIAMLRQVCERHGDNDWPDDLHLGDVIEKHLWRNLEVKK